jgi:hypothetical protein
VPWYVALDIALAAAGLLVVVTAGVWLWRRTVAAGRDVRGAVERLARARAGLSSADPRR